MTTTPERTRFPAAVLALAAALAALGAGCGGGSGDAAPAATAQAAGAHPLNGVGSGGTGRAHTYASGPIASFNAVVVNGVHYDDTGATIVDDDGLSRTAADLHVGSEVTIDAGVVTNGSATASRIQIHSDLVGPVDQPWTAASGTLVVMGQPVVVSVETALDAFAGDPSTIAPGTVVEVSSILDPSSGRYAATRLDPHAPGPVFKTRGVVAALDTKGKTLRVGTQVFAYAAIAAPPKLKNGQLVCVEALPVRNAAQQWVVTAFVPATAAPADGVHAEIVGDASAVVDATHYTVGNLAVDASAAAVTPTGAVVANGTRVSVSGSTWGGVLVAASVVVGVAPAADSPGDGSAKGRSR